MISLNFVTPKAIVRHKPGAKSVVDTENKEKQNDPSSVKEVSSF